MTFGISKITAQDLSEHRWESRLLLVLSDNFENDNYQKQISELKSYPAGLEERRLLIYRVERGFFIKGLESDKLWASEALYRQFKKSSAETEVVLIGLDGGVKLRQDNFLSCEKLFAVIDAMPMRRNELRQDRE